VDGLFICRCLFTAHIAGESRRSRLWTLPGVLFRVNPCTGEISAASLAEASADGEEEADGQQQVVAMELEGNVEFSGANLQHNVEGDPRESFASLQVEAEALSVRPRPKDLAKAHDLAARLKELMAQYVGREDLVSAAKAAMQAILKAVQVHRG